ncbi:ribonuclease H-like domain-containing protein [Coemansia spiralis]|nr:ribonuclease H-like domain-containing protein [Coemansia spiralis]
MQSDFVASFDSSLAAAYSALMKATKTASKLPVDINFHRALDEQIDQKLTAVSHTVLNTANQLWRNPHQTEIESVDDIALKKGDAWEAAPGFLGVVDAVDTILEKIDVGLDEVLKRPAHHLRASAHESTVAVGGRSTGLLIVHKNTPRPQLSFKDVVDNSASTPFVWKIRRKPHAKVPLDHGLPSPEVAESPLGHHLHSLGISRPGSPGADTPEHIVDLSGDEAGSLARLPHPYEFEIKTIEHPERLFDQAEPKEPGDWAATPFEFVDTSEQLQRMMEHLTGASEIAIDLEHHSYRTYQGFTCLIQISTRSNDYVVDSLALRGELECLNEVTADPAKVKVFHGADSDIPWLQRDFGVYIVGLFDTFQASKVLNMPHHSLAYLLKTYCGYAADKKYQLADWRIRPLPEEMLTYARADTHFLLYIFDRMRNELLVRGRELVGIDVENPTSAHFGRLWGMDIVESAIQPMELVLQRSARTSLRKYVKDGYDVETGLGTGGWAVLLKKWRHPFTPIQLAVYRALHRWRDMCARDEDESTRYVLPNHMLFAVAARIPEDVPTLLATCQPTPPLVRLYASDIVMMINQERKAAENKLENVKVQKETVMPKPVHTRFDDEELMDVDSQVPSDVLSSELLDSVSDMIAPSSTLFGPSLTFAEERNVVKGSPEAQMARDKARDIRSNLVLTVAIPKSLQTAQEEEGAEFTPAKRKATESKDEPQKKAIVISETYSRPTDHSRRVDTLDLSRIALGDIDDSNPELAKKPSKKKKPRKEHGSVVPGEVKAFDYDVDGTDAIGETKLGGQDRRRKKRQRDGKFDPYSTIVASRELATTPRKSRTNAPSGNRSMTFKK